MSLELTAVFREGCCHSVYVDGDAGKALTVPRLRMSAVTQPKGTPTTRRWLAILALAIAASGTPLVAQQPPYVPSSTLPNGRQIVAMYFGARDCGPCLVPEVKNAIRNMKLLLSEQAKASGAAFAAIGVANDWSVPVAAAFLEEVGPFDQVVLGGNWTNVAIERFVWRDSTGVPEMPQVLVFERTVTPTDRGIVFSDWRLLRRVKGMTEIPEWVKAGAPVDLASSPTKRKSR